MNRRSYSFRSRLNCAVVILLLFSLCAVFGCSASYLKGRTVPGPLSDQEMTGTVDLILYGANHGNDLETIAILDNEGDGYVFEPYAPEFNFMIIRHVPAREAIAEARRFVSWHRSFHEIRSSAVLDEKGQIVGYEIRPLYYPFDFGISDVLDVDYIIRGKKIVVKIRLENNVERMLMDGSDGLNIDLR